ncbi:Rrf2 family transcriptional regulator, partial [Marinobacter sp. AC-23]|uniref:RrF2 family transcriptional regulator n=1 Tax=Marinobacter sp. AC-23 TaxID=1879031 RepID=UPI0008DCD255
MHITRYTDYSLRVLMYLAVQGDRLATIQEIADSYDISKNHLMKVVHQLNIKGYIETVRGKKGGLKLRMATEDINVGVLVRETEHDLSVVECFTSKNACKITPVCGLKPMFGEALQAFLSVLDKYTLKDVM